jgi:hypothetical protein
MMKSVFQDAADKSWHCRDPLSTSPPKASSYRIPSGAGRAKNLAALAFITQLFYPFRHRRKANVHGLRCLSGSVILIDNQLGL